MASSRRLWWLLSLAVAASLVGALAMLTPIFPTGIVPKIPEATPPCPFIVASSPATLSTSTPVHILSPCPGILMSTYFGGSLMDWANDVAVDAAGSIYVVGYTNSTDFPVTPGGFDPEDPPDCYYVSTYDTCQDGFLLKLDSSGALVFSTLLGGSSGDEASSVAVDASGSVYVTGSTWSVDFPTTLGAYQATHGGDKDVFVMKFDSAGSLVYSTFLGGSSGERRSSISVDAFGNAYVSGTTYSPDFPVTEGALRAADSGAFVAKLHSSGAALDYVAIIGDGYLVTQSTVDAEGSVYVTTVPFYLSDEAGDVLVYKLNPAGSELEYMMLFGGSGTERPAAITIDDLGRAYVTGYTTSEDFPTTPGAFDTHMDLDWHEEAFLTVIDPTGVELAYSTFFGGVGDEFGTGVYVDGSGVVYLAGRKEFASRSDTGGDFPTTQGAFDRTHNGGSDGFVAKLDLGGNLIYSTFLGGGDEAWYNPRFVPVSYCDPCGDSIQSLAIDATGNATVVGGTASLDFPVTEGALDTTYNGGPHDIFVLRIELIPEPNRAPVAYFEVQGPHETDGRFSANASNSADPEDADGLLEVRWDWEDDGIWTEWSTIKEATHAYACASVHTVRLQVRDTEGLTNETTRDVDVTGGPSYCPSPIGWDGLLRSWTSYPDTVAIAGGVASVLLIGGGPRNRGLRP